MNAYEAAYMKIIREANENTSKNKITKAEVDEYKGKWWRIRFDAPDFCDELVENTKTITNPDETFKKYMKELKLLALKLDKFPCSVMEIPTGVSIRLYIPMGNLISVMKGRWASSENEAKLLAQVVNPNLASIEKLNKITDEKILAKILKNEHADVSVSNKAISNNKSDATFDTVEEYIFKDDKYIQEFKDKLNEKAGRETSTEKTLDSLIDK